MSGQTTWKNKRLDIKAYVHYTHTVCSNTRMRGQTITIIEGAYTICTSNSASITNTHVYIEMYFNLDT